MPKMNNIQERCRNNIKPYLLWLLLAAVLVIVDQISKYLTVLKSQIESMDADAFLYSLDRVEAWKSVRNEIVHAMLNKNIDSLEDRLKPLAEEGMQIARIIDNQERILKKGNKIRRKINLSMN